MNKHRVRVLGTLIGQRAFPRGFGFNIDCIWKHSDDKVEHEGFSVAFRDSMFRCDTVGCIAGWAVWLFGGEGIDLLNEQQIEDEAQRILELTDEEKRALFYPHVLMDDALEQVPSFTPERVGRVLHHFSDTGRIEWSIT